MWCKHIKQKTQLFGIQIIAFLFRTRSGNTKYKILWNSINLNTTDIQHITNINIARNIIKLH